jgi:hypothetical protein
MARIRTIKPEFWKHEALSALPEGTHMLAAALLNYADDDGYFNANPRLIQAECCPLREPSVSIHDSLLALSNVGYLRLGNGADGRTYGHIVAFADHQRINRPTVSKIKSLDIDWGNSLSPHPQLTEPSPPEGKGKEGKGTGKGERASAPPATKSRKHTLPSDYTLTETLMAKARAALEAAGKPAVDWKAEFVRFCEHFWSPDSRNRAKSDWDRAFVNWCLSDYSKPPASQRSNGHGTSVEGKAFPSPNAEATQWRARLKSYKPGGYWNEFWGERPGDPNCQVPRAILEEFGLDR